MPKNPEKDREAVRDVEAYRAANPDASDREVFKNCGISKYVYTSALRRLKGKRAPARRKSYERVDLAVVDAAPRLLHGETVTAFIIKGSPQMVAQVLAGAGL